MIIKKYITLANFFTALRIFLVMPFVWFFYSSNLVLKIIAFLIFIFAAITDYLDGRYARKKNESSDFGKFFDPLADKILIIVSLVTFSFYKNLYIPLWMIIIILLRDGMITLIRTYSMKKNRMIETSFLAKFKTAFQMTTIIFILCLDIIRTGLYSIKGFEIEKPIKTFAFFFKNYTDIYYFIFNIIPYILMSFLTILTVISGINYLFLNKDIFKKNE